MSSLLKASTVFALSFVFLSACRSQSDSSATESPSPETVISSTPPFQTREPERYRATRTITILTPNGQTSVTRVLLAKDGELRRSEFTDDGTIYLETPEGRFVLIPEANAYADLAADKQIGSVQDGEVIGISPEGFLHSDANTTTNYQPLGTETVEGRSANKYRVVVNGSSGNNVSLSETLIWIDGDLNMPIKSETKSAEGASVTVLLSEISLQVDKSMFQIPEGYEKVTFSELQKRLKRSE